MNTFLWNVCSKVLNYEICLQSGNEKSVMSSFRCKYSELRFMWLTYIQSCFTWEINRRNWIWMCLQSARGERYSATMRRLFINMLSSQPPGYRVNVFVEDRNQISMQKRWEVGEGVIKHSIHQHQIAGLWTVCNENVNFRVINNELVGYYRY